MRGERGGEEIFVQKRARPVFVAQAPLLHHHLDLLREFFRAHHEIYHAVGFEPHRERQAVAVDLLVIDGEIGGSEGVLAPARLRYDPREFTRAEAPGALEHHVLEHVRDPGHAGHLVHAAHPIPHLMHDGGRAVVFLDDQAQAVRKAEFVRVRLRRRDERERGGENGGA